MKRTALVISLLVVALVLSTTAQTISTQGVLRDSDGHSVEDGDYTMTFSIYGAETGGTLLWGPGTQTVTVENGIYHVVLGEDSPITSFNSDGSNYLEISVENETMTPRLRLNVSPYELSELSGSSNTVPGSGNVGIGTTNPQAKLSIVAPGDNVDLLHFDENSDSEKEFSFQGMFSPAGGANGLKLRSQWVDKIMFWRGDGNVGIGTQDPAAKLHVEGTIYSPNQFSTRTTNIGQSMEKGTSARTTLRFDSDSYRIYAGGTGGVGSVLTALESGKVGIGTTTPDQKLVVNGGSDVTVSSGAYIQTGLTSGSNIGIDDNEIMARNNGSTSTLYLNTEGGTVNVGGDAQFESEIEVQHGSSFTKPFQFVRYSGSGENCTIATTYSEDDWIAAVVGFDAGSGDIDEGGTEDLWQINCAVASDGNWEIFCDAPTHNNYPDWQIYVMFVSTKLGSATTGYKSH